MIQIFQHNYYYKQEKYSCETPNMPLFTHKLVLDVFFKLILQAVCIFFTLHLEVLSVCCLVYSHISRAPLTWTFSERTTPNWGISTQSSRRWMISTGIPSRSLLYVCACSIQCVRKWSCAQTYLRVNSASESDNDKYISTAWSYTACTYHNFNVLFSSLWSTDETTKIPNLYGTIYLSNMMIPVTYMHWNMQHGKPNRLSMVNLY